MSSIPVDLGKVKREQLDTEILRAAVIAELDAINLYEQMAALATDEKLRKVLLDVAKEEKTHVGEFQAMLLLKDDEQADELEHGKEEVEEILG